LLESTISPMNWAPMVFVRGQSAVCRRRSPHPE
jgi:hypothetical protein